jgi:hypothetical protein
MLDMNLGTTMKAWEYKKIKFMCKGIHYKKSTYANQSAQWNQGEKEYHLSGGSSESLFTLKEVNVKIKKYFVGRVVQKKIDMSR